MLLNRLTGFEIAAGQAAVVKTGGDKRARNAFALESGKIGAIAHAAGRVDVPAGGGIAYCA